MSKFRVQSTIYTDLYLQFTLICIYNLHWIVNSSKLLLKMDLHISEGNGECFTNPLATDYRGTISVTKNGRTCQKWTDQSPHSHSKTPDNYPYSGLGDHNFCRNPDNDNEGAWCYTIDPVTRYEYCDVSTPEIRCGKCCLSEFWRIYLSNSVQKWTTNPTSRSTRAVLGFSGSRISRFLGFAGLVNRDYWCVFLRLFCWAVVLEQVQNVTDVAWDECILAGL